ncbi:MAG: D-alanyl-D-alanine carboxypeptidase family protein [Anaerolineae bacterium]|nr:D-alanyl-D-alanine carboxypeptidase family protein [Gloeobacterales cyanobacterium ES-bin-313]
MEELTFMRQVYNRQLEQTSRGRKPSGDLPASHLAVIEGKLLAKPQAALAARCLLKAARIEIQHSYALGVLRHSQVQGIGVMSAYRPPSRQFANWQENFPQYYKSTRNHRRALSGGEFGEAAVESMVFYIKKRLASPGFSMHNYGLAIDFKARENGVLLTTSTNKTNIAAWRDSWFYMWLSHNARKYRFHLNPHINEPWHWEYQ